MSTFYDIPVTTIDGKDTTMGTWAGHALLIVNTASECGLTEQYEQLQELFEGYMMRGFYVIGMPCNQFGEQEPGSNAEIADFVQSTFGVEFPMLAKAEVNGENTHPLFAHLKEATGGEDISWNFEKFLVNDSGEVTARFAPKTEPDDDEVIAALEEILPI
ncbi:glutathione peroxidase [Corynebacterium ciconiae]|uniref:glutathione peroxidase n=1 Tax=Corynebacterium ciconiae TaxID=227319 RepID=UPI00036D60F9|nr:glutathione peroxidase [Corynebacterium ciconiae]